MAFGWAQVVIWRQCFFFLKSLFSNVPHETVEQSPGQYLTLDIVVRLHCVTFPYVGYRPKARIWGYQTLSRVVCCTSIWKRYPEVARILGLRVGSLSNWNYCSRKWRIPIVREIIWILLENVTKKQNCK